MHTFVCSERCRFPIDYVINEFRSLIVDDVAVKDEELHCAGNGGSGAGDGIRVVVLCVYSNVSVSHEYNSI